MTRPVPPGYRLGIFRWGKFIVMVAIEDGKWHLSISHPTRDLTYAEIKAARNRFIPDEVTVAMIFPPRSEFVNAHEHCFHLWEIPGEQRSGMGGDVSLHHPIQWNPDGFLDEPKELCEHCLDLSGDHEVAEWPCPTIREARERGNEQLVADLAVAQSDLATTRAQRDVLDSALRDVDRRVWAAFAALGRGR